MQQRHSNQDPIVALADRLATVERSHRRLRRVLSVFLLLGAAVAAVGAAALIPDTIAARSFRLVDAGGAERAALAAGDRGTAVVTLYAGEGARALTMTLMPVAPFVVVADAEGTAIGPPASALSPQPAAEPAKRGRIGWGKTPPAGGKEEEDDSFDWAD
jgi:hypothetical protein